MLKCLSLLTAVCSIILVAGCGIMPPVTPDAPTGPTTGDVGVSYRFTAVTSDPQGLPLRYQFVWGDEQRSEWSLYAPSGEPVTMGHAWQRAGAFNVKVRAENVSGRVSDFSSAHIILIGDQSGYPDTLLANIPTTDGHPQNLVCPRNTGRVYVTGEWDNAVYVIRTSDNTIVQTLHMNCGPTHIDCSPNGEYVYIGSFDEIHPEVHDRLYSIRTRDNAVVDSVDLLGCPHGVACLPSGEYIYVSLDYPTNKVAVIRASDFSVVANISVGGEPRGIAAVPDGECVYVTCAYTDSVYVIRTSDNTVADVVYVGYGDHRLAVLPSGDYVYVSRYEGGAPIKVIRTSDNTVVDSVPVSYGRPCGLASLPSGQYVYVTNRDANCVDIIRTSDNTVVKTVGVGSIPYGAASLPDGSGVYVANRGNSVSFIGYGR